MGWTTEEVDKYVAKLEKNITGPTEVTMTSHSKYVKFVPISRKN